MKQRYKSKRQANNLNDSSKRKQFAMPIEKLAKLQTEKSQDFKKIVIQRNAVEEQKKQKQKQQQRRYFVLSYIHFKLIHNYRKDVVMSCIRYLVELSFADNRDKTLGKSWTIEQISQNLLQINNKKSASFLKFSTSLLNKQIVWIAQSCQDVASVQHKEFVSKNSLDVKVEIMAYIFKSTFFLQEYLITEESDMTRFKFNNIYKHFGYDVEQFKILKKIYMEHKKQIKFAQFLDNLFEINKLTFTFYLIYLKQRLINKWSQEPAQQLVEKAIQQIQNRQKQKQNEEDKMEVQKVYLSQLFAEYQKQKKHYRVQSFHEFTQVLSTFDQLMKDNEKPTTTHPKIKLLCQKYNIEPFQCCSRFFRYETNKITHLERHGNHLNKFKNLAIGQYIIRNIKYSFQSLCRTIYARKFIWIEQAYFNANIFEIIKQETQYQQLKYLGKLLKGMNEALQDGADIAFVGSFRFGGIEDSTDIQFTGKRMMMVATFSGELYWTLIQDTSNLTILYEASKMLRNFPNSLLLYCDKNFPSINPRQKVELKKYTLSYFLPKNEAMPDPIGKIAALIKENRRRSLDSKQRDDQIIRDVDIELINSLRHQDVKAIVRKQWQKVQQLVLPKTNASNTNFLSDKLEEVSLDSQRKAGQRQVHHFNKQVEKIDEEKNSSEDQSPIQNDSSKGQYRQLACEQLQALKNLQGKNKVSLQEALARLLQLNNLDLFYNYKMSKTKSINMSIFDFIKTHPKAL